MGAKRMVKIASHLVPETQTALDKLLVDLHPTYTPVCAWGDDVTVQWGNGIIPATPFFEAFPPGTFIRGEGETIEAAERSAFKQYEREKSCTHFFGRYHSRRGTYTNGGAFCHFCGRFESRYFPPIVELGAHRKPLKRREDDYLTSIATDEELTAHMDEKYPEKKAERERYQKLLRIRKKLYGVDPESSRFGMFG